MGVEICCFSHAHNFEVTAIPSTISVDDGKSILSLSKEYFKDGEQSLCWNWQQNNAILKFSDADIKNIVNSFANRSGIKLWIYNETPQNQPLVFNFKDEEGQIQYTFNFYLNYTGWRACWIAYKDMWTVDGGNTTKKYVTTMEIVSPQGVNNGKLWLDRLEYSKNVDVRTAPDAQIPENNRHLNREIWHWGLLHKWEQAKYDIPLPDNITTTEKDELNKIYNNIKNLLKKKTLSSSEKSQLTSLLTTFSISDDGKKGAPLMQNDNCKPGDVSYAQLNQLLDLLSRGWYIDRDVTCKTNFVKAIRYMLNQGFAYESGMGTNHHYGYNIRDIFGAIWWMEDVLKENNLWEETHKTITYWSGLQETRLPYNKPRDEITDSWNTLILPRLACVMMMDTEAERLRAMRALSRWLNGSLFFTPGTIGGIKIDGTSFHHGGHYPAYSVPGFASIGKYLSCVNGTQYTLDENAFHVFKFALLSTSKQTNLRDWGIGICGRHPFNGTISKAGVNAFAYAALSKNPVDIELASEYLRLLEGLSISSEETTLMNSFKKAGITKAEYPQGFYNYNYACLGVYRYNEKMVCLKGFTKNIWGAEIYSQNNRYGRYQSYGSIQIIGTRSPNPINNGYPITEESSRFVEPGWDWNRNPGTTTIHLPFNLLNSPTDGSGSEDMYRQLESFAGSSSLLNGKYGMFAMKISEPDRPNFTPSFKSYKSAFCIDNKIICLGSNISNDNFSYETETTLFQQNLLSESEAVEYNGTKITQFPFKENYENKQQSTLIKDLTGYYYYIPAGQSFIIQKQNQDSYDNKYMKSTNGSFATAYFQHGFAPKKSTYEYMIVMDPVEKQLSDLKSDITDYQVLQKDTIAHIIKDLKNQVNGYAIFENYTSDKDEYLLQSDKEIMILLKAENDVVNFSVCYPDINIGTYTYTSSTESQPITKNILIRGKYELIENNSAITLSQNGNNTLLNVTLQHGIPVEFSLQKIKENANNNVQTDGVKIYSMNNNIIVDSNLNGIINIYDTSGKLLLKNHKIQRLQSVPISQSNLIIQFITQNKQYVQKVLCSLN